MRYLIPASLGLALLGAAVYADEPETNDEASAPREACQNVADRAAAAYGRATRPIINRDPSNDLSLALVELQLFAALGCPSELLEGLAE